MINKITLLVFLLILLCSCTSSNKLTLQEFNFNDITKWEEDNHIEALMAFRKSCDIFSTLPTAKPIHKSNLGGKYRDWENICNRANKTQNPKKFFESNFIPYKASNNKNEKGTFTGYFEIALNGSSVKTEKYQYPIYKRPVDLTKDKKYYSRKQIQEGKLEGKNLELLWVDSPVQLFFLHIQGSGKIKMTDGSVVSVGYNGKNNRKYTSIGRHMIDEGYIKEENISATSIKNWLSDNPNKAFDVMAVNKSYIFFKKISNEGPIGAQSAPLTPLRSLAIDKEFIPYGLPIWLDVKLNKKSSLVGDKNGNLRRLMVSQDTGSAIKGPVRGDIFFGYGEEARRLASHQNSEGEYYLLLPKGLQ